MVPSFEDSVAAGADLLHLRHVLHILQHHRRPLRPTQLLASGVVEYQSAANIRWSAVNWDVWYC